MIKVYIIQSDKNYERMFREREGYQLVDRLNDADLVQFTGGADVSPDLYGEGKNPHTFNNPERDRKEQQLYKACTTLRIPMAGICRGGQFLNVMNGGKMWQHVNGHAISDTHMLTDIFTEVRVPVTSTHHQMMEPGEHGMVIAVASESTFKETDTQRCNTFYIPATEPWQKVGTDVEVVHYPDTQCLCFQPHPEYGVKECEDYYFELLEDVLELGD
jgi:gamma-glutamyl-gamma-aminobutyrate hydrolase PuuD